MPRDFPQMAIRVLKVSRITAPKRFLRGLNYFRAGAFCLLHNGIDFFRAVHIMANAEFRWTSGRRIDCSIVSEARSRIEGKPKIILQIKEYNRAVLEFFPFGSFGGKPKPVPIKMERSI